MRFLFVFYFLLFANVAIAQKNVVKVRAIYLPFQTEIYSFGLGYERFVGNKTSVQILYNYKGGTFGFDAPATYVKGFVPEVRYYFGKKEDFRKKYFIAGFIELYKQKEYPGMQEPSFNAYLTETNGNLTSLGVLIGKNMAIGKHFMLDVYIGYRHKFFDGERTYRNSNGEYYDVDFKEQEPGARAGINLGFLF